ncbi:MAG: transposase [Phycisphaeraceae bacterium]|nr:MAG: transposase [Phycisphaeraceae bacterium]
MLALDGKALRVASHSGDRTATFGAWGLRGYKLHAICDLAGSIVSWRLTPMHCHEAVMAKRMMRDMELNGYVLADSNYDSVKLYELCACKGGQLVVPRKDCRVGRGVRRSGTHPDRRRAIDMLEQSMTGFGRGLLSLRRVIERVFARLEMTHHVGLIPPHVRGIERVRRWIQAIIILDRHTQAMKR